MTNPYTVDAITLSPLSAEGLSSIGIGDFDRINDPVRMACVVFVLPNIRDDPVFFPKGKWATIQEIQSQLNRYGLAVAQAVGADEIKDPRP